MALYLRMARNQYGIQGLIPLTQGDDWTLIARVVDLFDGTELDQNISGSSISGFFPAASGGFIQGGAMILDPICGQVELTLPQSSSSGAALALEGTSPYITLQNSSGLQTIYTFDQPLQISARGMVQY